MPKPSTTDPIRVLTAVPICDGHDSAINTVNLEFVRNGIEVIYLGYHRPVRDVVRAAIQENVRAVGISSYNGGHVEYFAEVVQSLKDKGAGDIAVFGGGGGTISADDVKEMERRGVEKIFPAGTPLTALVNYVKSSYSRKRKLRSSPKPGTDRYLAKLVAGEIRAEKTNRDRHAPLTIGITGPGGAGKTTLIDELVLRVLKSNDNARVAVLSHDPSIVSFGALLGDRAAMIWSQNDRVFMHSLATRGREGGLSPQTEAALRSLRNLPFDVIFVETVGTGQEATPFKHGLVDKSLFVMSPEYGSRLQLQKIAMLDLANFVVINKSDLAGARTAASEVEQRVRANHANQQVISTVSKHHRDAGVDRLFKMLTEKPNHQDTKSTKKKKQRV
ncbi:MAG: cobalamin B12-binding domain-containing protein [Anaerolineae bacterium]|nr:cobalamin B12-binding domain-containing protein [Phycisphaerae bacterium]